MENNNKSSKAIRLEIEGEELIFDFRKAIYWFDKQILIISDFHIGKTGHFRKNGIAISNSVSRDDFQRLDDLLIDYPTNELFIIGDLSHSKMNKEWEHFLEFRKKHESLKVLLVPGNHDILNDLDYEEARIERSAEIHFSDPFAFIHEAKHEHNLSQMVISGHVHPGIRLKGAGRQAMTLACFHISDKNIILPAFSNFTGRFKINPKKGDRVLPLSKKEIFLITK
jgi:uncharacterized protein